MSENSQPIWLAGDSIEGTINWVEFITEFKGERAQVRSHSIERVGGKHDADVHFFAYVIEGTIEEVVSFPPGFHLRDVRESMERARRDMSKQGKPLETMGSDWSYNPDIQGIRCVDHKFVSFQDIDQIEFPDREETKQSAD